MKKMILVLLLFSLASGCQEEERKEDINVSPVKQKTTEERKKNHTEKSSDNRFQDKEALAIAEKVNRMKEIAASQVFFREDQVHVAVSLNRSDLRDMEVADKVREVVKKETDRSVKVYTDRSYKETMDNLSERQRAGRLGEAIEQFFRSPGE